MDCIQNSARANGYQSVNDMPCPNCDMMGVGVNVDCSPTFVDQPHLAVVPASLDGLMTQTQSQSTMPLLMPCGNPVPRLIDEVLGFNFQDAAAAAPAADTEDPVASLMDNIRNASTLSDLRVQIHPPDLCRELTTASTVKQTILSWLREIDSDTRDHQQIGSDSSFPIGLLVPIPYWKAIATVSMQQGWPAEALLQGVSVNTGWLEHHATRLVDVPGAHHKRTPSIAAFYSAPPSLRKSSFKELLASKLFATASMHDKLRDGSLVCGDGTVKGLKACIEDNDRAGLVSDEVTSCYEPNGPKVIAGCIMFAAGSYFLM